MTTPPVPWPASRSRIADRRHGRVWTVLSTVATITALTAGNAHAGTIFSAARLAPTETADIAVDRCTSSCSGRVWSVGFVPRLDAQRLRRTTVVPVSFSTYSRAWSLITSSRLDEAERMLLAIRGSVPSWYEWLIDDGLAWIKFYREDYEGAREAFSDNLNRHPVAYLSRKGLGFIALEQGKYDEAFQHLKISLQQNPYQILVSYTIPAQRFVEAGRYDLANAILDVGDWVYPQSSDIKFLFARALIGQGDRDRAAEYATEAASLAPAYIDPVFDDLNFPVEKVLSAYLALGWGLMFVGDNEGGLRRFQQILSNGGQDLNAIRGRGFALYRLGRNEEALADLKLAAKSEPDLLQPITEAIPGPDPDDKRTWEISYNATSTMAWAYYFRGEFGGAARLFKLVLENYPDWSDARTGLGYTFLKMGEAWRASKEFQKALNLLPGYPYAARGMTMAGSSRRATANGR